MSEQAWDLIEEAVKDVRQRERERESVEGLLEVLTGPERARMVNVAADGPAALIAWLRGMVKREETRQDAVASSIIRPAEGQRA